MQAVVRPLAAIVLQAESRQQTSGNILERIDARRKQKRHGKKQKRGCEDMPENRKIQLLRQRHLTENGCLPHCSERNRVRWWKQIERGESNRARTENIRRRGEEGKW